MGEGGASLSSSSFRRLAACGPKPRVRKRTEVICFAPPCLVAVSPHKIAVPDSDVVSTNAIAALRQQKLSIQVDI